MRPYGFSSGALAFSDLALALRLSRTAQVDAIELSALRLEELEPLLRFVETADLSGFSFISVHAPSDFSSSDERRVVRQLRAVADRGWPIVVHPDTVHTLALWGELGDHLLIENMDRRKQTGRTAHELDLVFQEQPMASMCFDIAHARQFDTSMTEAYKIIRDHGDRIRQVHISEVNTSSKHDLITPTAVRAFQEVAHLISRTVPVILETPARGQQIEEQLSLARSVFDPLEARRRPARSSG